MFEMKIKLTYKHGNTEFTDPVESGMFDTLDGVTEQDIYDAYCVYAGEWGCPVNVEVAAPDAWWCAECEKEV